MDETVTLDRLRAGASMVSMIARARLSEAVECLERGEYRNALGRATEAINRLSSLAEAEHNLANFADMTIKRAKDLAEGDRVYSLGIIERLSFQTVNEGDPTEQQVSNCVFDDGTETAWRAETELVVVNPEAL